MLGGFWAYMRVRCVLGVGVSTLSPNTLSYCFVRTIRGFSLPSGLLGTSMSHPPSQVIHRVGESYPQDIHRVLVLFLGNLVV